VLVLATIASLVAGTALLAAAAMKIAEPAASRVALGTYGIAGRLAVPAWAALVAAEAVLGAGLLAGSLPAADAAAALLALFAAAQLAVLALGRGGAPCGCLGGRGRVSPASVARAALLGGAALAAAALGGGAGGWARGLVAAAGLLAAASVALLLQRAPDGALDVAGEGPDPGTPLVGAGGPRVLLFTSSTCRLCARVRRGLARSGAGAEVVELDEERDAALWLHARVPGAPYAVVVDGAGVVRAKGTVNTAAQVRSLVAAVGIAQPASPSRRGFLQRAAATTAAVAAADAVSSLVRPGEAEAYHFCGHIYTTDSCPHPTGLPRIDAKGYPLRAADGHRVDDLGRAIDPEGYAIGDDGAYLLDADGRRLPRAPRTKVCTAVGARYGFPTQIDGAWYRCCKGHVRKLIDCCADHPRRINGDKALTGYCYRGRKVFCVMFHQTKVPC
jgi:glutaredoxin